MKFKQFNPKEISIKEAYHLLIGFSGSAQNTGALLSQEQALRLVDSLYIEINKEVDLGFDLVSVFSRFALDFSIDPSVKNNQGALGWVPWGQTIMSFQKPLFELEKNTLSAPLLTDFGYHLILVSDVRPSDYQYMSNDEYESVI